MTNSCENAEMVRARSKHKCSIPKSSEAPDQGVSGPTFAGVARLD